jgi:hypothetical protein
MAELRYFGYPSGFGIAPGSFKSQHCASRLLFHSLGNPSGTLFPSTGSGLDPVVSTPISTTFFSPKTQHIPTLAQEQSEPISRVRRDSLPDADAPDCDHLA